MADPADVIRTPGSESNVKEIYDACNALAQDPANVVLNQFCEFGNHLAHLEVTGRALGRVVRARGGRAARACAWPRSCRPPARPAPSPPATGLKERYGTRIVAVEALECPTMLENGFGEHNIQGIGDKHIPLIHNVMNTDVVAAVSDRATDELDVLFNTDAGRGLPRRAPRRRPPTVVDGLRHFGLSSICNVLAAVKTAKLLGLGPDDAVITVATDGAALYGSERAKTIAVALRRRVHRGRRGPGVRRAPRLGERPTTCSSAPSRTATASSTSATTRGSSSRARRSRCSRPAARSGSGRTCERFPAVWDELIGEFNARTGLA